MRLMSYQSTNAINLQINGEAWKQGIKHYNRHNATWRVAHSRSHFKYRTYIGLQDWRLFGVCGNLLYCAQKKSINVNLAGSTPTDRAQAAKPVFRAIWVSVMAISLSGCGGEVQAKLEDYLEELEFDTPLESVKVIQLGENYRISIPAHKQAYVEGGEEPIWVQIKFKLFVVTAPEDESALLAASERHQGMISDIIVNICRNMTLEELDDHRRTTLKSRLIDALRPLLGEDRIQQLILNDDSWEVI